MKKRYEILLNENVWIRFPKSRDGLADAMEEVYDRIADGMDANDFRIVYREYDAEGKLAECYDVVDMDWEHLLEKSSEDGFWGESMDGDFDSAMASAGYGTDEDYGYFGEDY